MRKYLFILFLGGLLSALSIGFQNCSDHQSFESLGEESNSSSMRFSGVDATEVPEPIYNHESNHAFPSAASPAPTGTEAAIIEQLRDSLEITKVYIGRERIFYFGHCNPDYGSYTELEVASQRLGRLGPRNYVAIGHCAAYRGSDPRFVNGSIAIGMGRVFSDFGFGEMHVRLRYLRGHGRIPSSAHQMWLQRQEAERPFEPSRI